MSGNYNQFNPSEMFKDWIQKNGRAQAEFMTNFGSLMSTQNTQTFNPLEALREISDNNRNVQSDLIKNASIMQSKTMSTDEQISETMSTDEQISETMSTDEQISETKDIFSLYQENTEHLFSSIRRSVPQYHQSITNIQQEYLQACEYVVNSTISLQKEYAQKVGIVTTMPQNTVKVITGTTHEFVKSNSIQNQMVLTTIDAIQQIIKTFNENVKSYVDLNKNTLKSWFFSFTTKNN